MNKSKITERIADMWYHHKWAIILIVFLIVFMTIALAQSLNKTEPDVHMLYIGPTVYTGRNFEQPGEEISALFSDNNQDGVKSISYIGITAYTESNSGTLVDAKYREESLRSFQTQAVYGDAFIFIVDVEFYEKLNKDLNLLADLSEVLDSQDIPEGALDNKGIILRDLDIAEMTGFCDFPRESILCLRRSPSQTTLNYDRTEEMYNDNLEFFRNIVKYKREPKLKRGSVQIVSSGMRVLNTFGKNKLDDTVYYLGKLSDSNRVLKAEYTGYSNIVTTDKNSGELIFDSQKTLDIVDKIIESKAQIVVVDRAVYKELLDRDLLENVSKISDKAGKYKNGVDNGLYLRDIPAYNMGGFCFLEMDSESENTLIVCFIKRTTQTKEEDSLAKTIFRGMLNDV